jgi:hypothetical protein
MAGAKKVSLHKGLFPRMNPRQHQCLRQSSPGNKLCASGVSAEHRIHRSAFRAEGDWKEIPMSFKSSLLIGIAVLALSATAPAVAQTTPSTTGSPDQIGAGATTDMSNMSTGMKHQAKKHHKRHAKMSSRRSSSSSEVAETNRLNQQQVSQARSGMSSTTAAGAGSQNENAATYSNSTPSTMGPPVGPGSTPPGPNNTPSDANPGTQPGASGQNPPR